MIDSRAFGGGIGGVLASSGCLLGCIDAVTRDIFMQDYCTRFLVHFKDIERRVTCCSENGRDSRVLEHRYRS